MTAYRDLLQQVRAGIAEIGAPEAAGLSDGPVFLDVRERDEWDEGHIPGAVHIPRGSLESRIEAAVPDHTRPIVVYCSAGNRSVFATKTLEELGYEDVRSLTGGFTDWKRNGFPTQLPRTLDADKRARYSRHLLIPEVGEEGQLRLLDSRVLLIGAGGLGSPASLLPGRGGRGTARDRRRRRGGRLQSPAPDRPLDRDAGGAQGGPRQRRRSRRSTPTWTSSRTGSA